MAREAKPYLHQGWYKTDVGGVRNHKLCPEADGLDKATALLREWTQQLATRKEADRKAGLVEVDTPILVEEIAAEFVIHKRATKKERTVEFYRFYLTRFIEWYGTIEAAKLNRTHADDFITRLKKLDMSNTAINHYIRSAISVLNYAVKCDRIVKNPWAGVPRLPENERKRIVTEEEFEKLLLACERAIAYRGKVSREENVQTMKDVLRILRFTALRPGELRKLRWDHLHGEFIIIPAREVKTGTTAKSPADRIIPCLPDAVAILERRRTVWGHQPLVFPNIFGGEWTQQVFSQRFARLRRRAKLDAPDHNGEKLVWYSLRHTRLTEAGVTEGMAYPILQLYAGHVPGSKITGRYTHPNKADLMRAVLEGQKKHQKPDDE